MYSCIYIACTQRQGKQVRGTHDPRDHASKHTKAMSDLHRHAKLALAYVVTRAKKISDCASPWLNTPEGFASPHGSTPSGSHYVCSTTTPCICQKQPNASVQCRLRRIYSSKQKTFDSDPAS
jgi:hypothetical protein